MKASNNLQNIWDYVCGELKYRVSHCKVNPSNFAEIMQPIIDVAKNISKLHQPHCDPLSLMRLINTDIDIAGDTMENRTGFDDKGSLLTRKARAVSLICGDIANELHLIANKLAPQFKEQWTETIDHAFAILGGVMHGMRHAMDLAYQFIYDNASLINYKHTRGELERIEQARILHLRRIAAQDQMDARKRPS